MICAPNICSLRASLTKSLCGISTKTPTGCWPLWLKRSRYRLQTVDKDPTTSGASWGAPAPARGRALAETRGQEPFVPYPETEVDALSGPEAVDVDHGEPTTAGRTGPVTTARDQERAVQETHFNSCRVICAGRPAPPVSS